MYDIQDDALPTAVVAKLHARGWRFDADAQEWRKYNDSNEHFSPHQADHNRAWLLVIREVVAEVEAETAAAQNNATPGHIGTADDLRSTQVKDFDDSDDDDTSALLTGAAIGAGIAATEEILSVTSDPTPATDFTPGGGADSSF